MPINYLNSILAILFLLQPLNAISSEPASLKQNAYAVINEFKAEFTQSNIYNGIYKEKKTITILNQQGDHLSYFFAYNDKFRNLTKFEGTIKDASGKIIKKIKKIDLEISTFSDDALASESRKIYYRFQASSYPYTIEYNYEEKWKNGILSYPSFIPVRNYNISLESAELTINLPLDMDLRYKENYDFKITNTKSDYNTYKFSLSNFNALKYEPLSPPVDESLPIVWVSLNEFCYDSFCGNFATWETYGLWVNDLLKERDKISPLLTGKIKSLTDGIECKRKKIKAIYEYLQANTRYVSIQLGIGGFRPSEALEVEKTGFGDCKGLTNYMKAMLKAIDIPSYYCEINMGDEKHLFKDFANAKQTNHVVLLVPLENDSIWLECTSQSMPFGYIHEDIAGHDALVMTENGGVIRRLPSYKNIQLANNTALTINLSRDGSASGNFYCKENLHSYEKISRIYNSNDRERKIRHLHQYFKLSSLSVNDIKSIENKSSQPFMEIETSFVTKDFGNITGKRMFIPACPLNKGKFNLFTSSKRNTDIYISSDFFESDTITFNIPVSYQTESLPKDIDIQTPYGVIQTKTTYTDNRITYSYTIKLSEGRYDKSEYEKIKEFFSDIDKSLNRQIVLKHL